MNGASTCFSGLSRLLTMYQACCCFSANGTSDPEAIPNLCKETHEHVPLCTPSLYHASKQARTDDQARRSASSGLDEEDSKQSRSNPQPRAARTRRDSGDWQRATRRTTPLCECHTITNERVSERVILMPANVWQDPRLEAYSGSIDSHVVVPESIPFSASVISSGCSV